MAKKSMRVIGEYTMITAATFVVAAAVYFFLIPSGVSVGSISGLAMLLGNVIPLPISVLTFNFKCGASGGGLSFYRTRVRRQDGVYVADSAGFSVGV